MADEGLEIVMLQAEAFISGNLRETASEKKVRCYRRLPSSVSIKTRNPYNKENEMQRYLIERTVGKLTQEQIKAATLKSNEVLEGMPGVTWIRSFYSEAEGKIYCEYYAPNPEAIREHAQKAGFPVDNITEVTLEFNPVMFR